MKPLPIVHINGFPGTGKLTIAGKLAARLNIFFEDLAIEHAAPPSSARLVHNHLLIDPANAVLHRTQPGYQTLRKAIRDAVFTSLVKESSTYAAIYIFTDWQSGDATGSSVCEEFRTMAQTRGSVLIPIIIKCDEEENVRRLAGLERSKYGKITDVDLLLQFRKQVDPPPVFRFDGHEHRIEVDVTDMSAEEAADVMFRHVVQFVS